MNYKLTTGFSDAFKLTFFCLISFKLLGHQKRFGCRGKSQQIWSNFPQQKHPVFWKPKPPKMVPDGCPITLVPIALSSSAPSVACVAAKRFGWGDSGPSCSDECAKRMQGGKNSSLMYNISRDNGKSAWSLLTYSLEYECKFTKIYS